MPLTWEGESSSRAAVPFAFPFILAGIAISVFGGFGKFLKKKNEKPTKNKKKNNSAVTK